MTADNFVPRLAQAKLAIKDDIADFVKERERERDLDQLKNLNKKIN